MGESNSNTISIFGLTKFARSVHDLIEQKKVSDMEDYKIDKFVSLAPDTSGFTELLKKPILVIPPSNYEDFKDKVVICAHDKGQERADFIEKSGATTKTVTATYSICLEIDKLGQGCLVFPFTTIEMGAQIKQLCIIGSNSIIGPDSKLGIAVTCHPGVIVGPRAEVGDYSILELGCVVKEGVKIGKECRVRAHMSISSDLPDGTTY